MLNTMDIMKRMYSLATHPDEKVRNHVLYIIFVRYISNDTLYGDSNIKIFAENYLYLDSSSNDYDYEYDLKVKDESKVVKLYEINSFEVNGRNITRSLLMSLVRKKETIIVNIQDLLDAGDRYTVIGDNYCQYFKFLPTLQQPMSISDRMNEFTYCMQNNIPVNNELFDLTHLRKCDHFIPIRVGQDDSLISNAFNSDLELLDILGDTKPDGTKYIIGLLVGSRCKYTKIPNGRTDKETELKNYISEIIIKYSSKFHIVVMNTSVEYGKFIIDKQYR